MSASSIGNSFSLVDYLTKEVNSMRSDWDYLKEYFAKQSCYLPSEMDKNFQDILSALSKAKISPDQVQTNPYRDELDWRKKYYEAVDRIINPMLDKLELLINQVKSISNSSDIMPILHFHYAKLTGLVIKSFKEPDGWLANKYPALIEKITPDVYRLRSEIEKNIIHDQKHAIKSHVIKFSLSFYKMFSTTISPEDKFNLSILLLDQLRQEANIGLLKGRSTLKEACADIIRKFIDHKTYADAIHYVDLLPVKKAHQGLFKDQAKVQKVIDRLMDVFYTSINTSMELRRDYNLNQYAVDVPKNISSASKV